MRTLGLGTKLEIEGLKCKVIGSITYKNSNDNSNRWVDYRLKTNLGERWLSVDNTYKEYSISEPSEMQGNQIGNEWKKVDEGNQIVVDSYGDVDVDPGEYSEFVEYEDEEGKNILSLEIWEDGTEVSRGHYIQETDIKIIEKSGKTSNERSVLSKIPWHFIIIAMFIFAPQIFDNIIPSISDSFGLGKTIEKTMKESTEDEYVTSITGKDKEKANVYRYKYPSKTNPDNDIKAKTEKIIEAIDGNTESVTTNGKTGADASTTILTKKEYCLVYHPEDKPLETYIQVSSRKFAYGSNERPYHANHNTFLWYNGNYYSKAYQTDSKKFKTDSPYKMYKGPIVQDMGNGYFDSYAGTIKQSSAGSRSSSGGGLSSGK